MPALRPRAAKLALRAALVAACSAPLAALPLQGASSQGQTPQATPPAPAAGTEQAALPKLPPWKGVRYEEDWSVLAGYPDEELDDPRLRLKYLPLDEDGDVWLSFGGHVRARFESWSGFNFGIVPPAADEDDEHALLRLYAHADLHVGEHFRAFVEGKVLEAFERDLPGGDRPVDEDELDLENGFVDGTAEIGDGRATLRLGRQELLFGKQRLVSPSDWANSRRTFDGVRAIYAQDPWTVSAFVTGLVEQDKEHFNDTDTHVDFYGVYSTTKVGVHDVDLYWLVLETDDKGYNGTAGGQVRHTLGARHGGPFTQGSPWDHDLEAAWQTGSIGDEDVDAWMVAAEIGRKFPEATWKPRAFLGFDYASGDDEPGGDVETFDQLFPAGHPYFGFIDAVGRQNIVDLHVGATAVPAEKWLARVDLHAFRLASDEDALYNPGGGVAIAPTGGEDHVGEELDLFLQWSPTRNSTVLVGYSHFFAGDLPEDAGPGDDIDFAYAAYQYTL